MPSPMVYSGNYTVGGAIMFGGNKENPISTFDGEEFIEINACYCLFFSFRRRVELGTGSDWFDVHCPRFL